MQEIVQKQMMARGYTLALQPAADVIVVINNRTQILVKEVYAIILVLKLIFLLLSYVWAAQTPKPIVLATMYKAHLAHPMIKIAAAINNVLSELVVIWQKILPPANTSNLTLVN